LGVQVYSLSIIQSTKWDDFPGVGVDAMRLSRIRDITLDSTGNVYILAEVTNGNGFHRIYKFAPATRNRDGSITLGELVGWMGACDSGPDCNYVQRQSVGFSCTDTTCAVETTQNGSGPGQFDNAAAIAVDPNDVLYVADGGNARVQRFSPAGLFAGEARSTGAGDSFVLGDFGRPDNIAVNKGSFYIIDGDDEIVHVFDAAVIHGIDETSAWVEYQSKNNFVGVDRFTFTASDGFRNAEGETLQSAPATVEINVTRNFRPPQASAGLVVTTTEDTPVALQLEGYDIDGALDMLTYQVASQPARGFLSGTPPNLTYTPDPDYADEDSFTFTVNDGRFSSPPEIFTILVEPGNDPPILAPRAASLSGGGGYPVTLAATVVDPDPDETHTVTLDWGDGTVQTEETLQGPGLSPSLGVTSTLLAYHHYISDGEYSLTVTVLDAAGATGEAVIPVTVGPMADLALQTTPPARTLGVNQSTLAYHLVVSNRPPEGGVGVMATSLVISETLGAGLRYVSAAGAGATCTASGQSLICSVDSLLPGASVTIDVEAAAAASSAGSLIPASAGVDADQPDPILDNNVWMGEVSIVAAADFLVNSYKDGVDTAPGDGVCATSASLCTLRAAVQEANALPGAQWIALGAGVLMLNVQDSPFAPTVQPTPEDNAVTGDLDIKDDLTIIGLDADRTTIHANEGDRVFEVHGAVTVWLGQVALSGGAPLEHGDGGGLRNNGGAVTLHAVAVTGNTAGGGGGLSNVAGTLAVRDSSITLNSTVEGGAGGGIRNEAVLLLENVTLSGNQAGSGGGILAQAGNAVLRNVTVYGNSASSAGGGINGNGEVIRLSNTILAGNSASTGPDCGSSLRSDGYNLIGELADCSVLGETASNIVGQSPGVDLLALNERMTASHGLLVGSRAIDAGSCVLTTDQRGAERPQGQSCDIGAVEYGGVSLGNAVYLPLVSR
jgi:CSLREA domain-containing protein